MVLIRLSDMSFSSVFSDPHCMYSLSTGGFGFNQIIRHELQFSVLRSSLMYSLSTGGFGFNQIIRHELQFSVVRSSLYVFPVYRWIWFNQIVRHELQFGVLRSSLTARVNINNVTKAVVCGQCLVRFEQSNLEKSLQAFLLHQRMTYNRKFNKHLYNVVL